MRQRRSESAPRPEWFIHNVKERLPEILQQVQLASQYNQYGYL